MSVHYTATHIIERVTHAVLYVFCICYTVISAVRVKHSSAALPCEQFVNKLTCANNLFVHNTCTHHIISLAIINRLFSLQGLLFYL